MDPGTGKTPAPRDAASIILVRDTPSGQLEILLMRRSREQSFMGGAFVFPGGRMDPLDADPGLVPHIAGRDPMGARAALQEEDLPELTAMGLYITALRETFEEAGVLLAYGPSGGLARFDGDEISGKFLEYRSRLYDHSMGLAVLAEKENLKFALDQLTPYAHWITPELERKRFDTRFFIARVPEGQEARHDEAEITESRWVTPPEALKEQRKGRLLLMPPTLKIITELSNFDTADALLRETRALRIVPILPQIAISGSTVTVKLPNDPEYTLESSAAGIMGNDVSRIILENGIWRTGLHDKSA